MGEHPSSVILIQSYKHTIWVSVSLLCWLHYAHSCGQCTQLPSNPKLSLVPIWLLPIWPQNLYGKERCIKRSRHSSFMSEPTRPTADVSNADVITGNFIRAVAKSPKRDAHDVESNIFHTGAVCAEKGEEGNDAQRE